MAGMQADPLTGLTTGGAVVTILVMVILALVSVALKPRDLVTYGTSILFLVAALILGVLQWGR